MQVESEGEQQCALAVAFGLDLGYDSECEWAEEQVSLGAEQGQKEGQWKE